MKNQKSHTSLLVMILAGICVYAYYILQMNLKLDRTSHVLARKIPIIGGQSTQISKSTLSLSRKHRINIQDQVTDLEIHIPILSWPQNIVFTTLNQTPLTFQHYNTTVDLDHASIELTPSRQLIFTSNNLSLTEKYDHSPYWQATLDKRSTTTLGVNDLYTQNPISTILSHQFNLDATQFKSSMYQGESLSLHSKAKENTMTTYLSVKGLIRKDLRNDYFPMNISIDTTFLEHTSFPTEDYRDIESYLTLQMPCANISGTLYIKHPDTQHSYPHKSTLRIHAKDLNVFPKTQQELSFVLLADKPFYTHLHASASISDCLENIYLKHNHNFLSKPSKKEKQLERILVLISDTPDLLLQLGITPKANTDGQYVLEVYKPKLPDHLILKNNLNDALQPMIQGLIRARRD